MSSNENEYSDATERDTDGTDNGSAGRSPSPGDATETTELDPSALSDRIETLEAENRSLRESVAVAKRRQYRYTALGFGVIGLLALVGAFAFPSLRSVLLALGGTGLFGAVLVYFLTPERFVAASVGERIYAALARNEAAVIEDLSLRGEPRVLPATGTAAPARLFVPLRPNESLSYPVTGTEPFRTDGTTGVLLEPTGAPLYDELLEVVTAIPETPLGIAATVGDALVEQFELVDAIEADSDHDRITLAIDGSAYGRLDQFDHPVVSVVAVTLAAELEVAVRPEVERGSRSDWLVTVRLDSAE